MKRLIWMALAASVMSFGLAGCTQEARQDYSEAGQKAGEATAKTGEAVATDARETGEAAATAAKAAGKEIKNAAENTKEAGDAALMTTKVKTALNTAAGLTTKDINVDTDMNTRTVMIKGSVPDAKQKAQAETVVKGIVGTEFKVSNQLTIGG